MGDKIQGIKVKKSAEYLLFVFVLLFGCRQEDPIHKISGEAQGTTYQISWRGNITSLKKSEVDSLLRQIDFSLSTYLPSSIISRINNNDSTVIPDKYFEDVYQSAHTISENTDGLFDVTVAPLLNLWGFGLTKKMHVDSTKVDSVLNLVGYKKIRIGNKRLIKDDPRIMIDFNAIAQGYTVDVICELLRGKGISDFLVELGGEVRASGKKNNNQFWRIGIDKPKDNIQPGQELQAVIELQDRSLATSGNYRKFYVEGGKRISHILDPRTGYPAKHQLLSATVIANDCMTADAYATAFMVMGLESAKEFLSSEKNPGLEVFFVYDDGGEWKTFSSDKMQSWIKEIP